ncbi:MAG: hypothetical protein NWS86_11445 [Flavobacteriales bacterium]|nr:hypothetical protein [Flavobacteriales bacterium]
MKHHGKPTSFEEIVPGPKEADLLVKSIREQHGLVCERCGNNRFSWLSRISHWQCNHCRKRISLKKGTFMEHSNMTVYDWLKLIFIMVDHKQSLAAMSARRTCGFRRYETTWYMMHRVRKFMADYNFQLYKSGVFGQDLIHEIKTRIRISSSKVKKQNRQVSLLPQRIPTPGSYGVSVMVLIASRGMQCEKNEFCKEKEHARYRYKNLISNLHLRYHEFQIITKKGSPPVQMWARNVLSNVERKLFGTHFTVSSLHLQLYLEEFTFKYFRRNDPQYFMETLKIGLNVMV